MHGTQPSLDTEWPTLFEPLQFLELLHWMLFEACTPQKIKKEIAQWFSVELGHCYLCYLQPVQLPENLGFCRDNTLRQVSFSQLQLASGAKSRRLCVGFHCFSLWSMLWWIIGKCRINTEFLVPTVWQVEKEKRRLEEVLRKRNDMVENHKQAAVLRCSKSQRFLWRSWMMILHLIWVGFFSANFLLRFANCIIPFCWPGNWNWIRAGACKDGRGAEQILAVAATVELALRYGEDCLKTWRIGEVWRKYWGEGRRVTVLQNP